MENNKSKILEKMYGKKILTELVRIEGVKEKVSLDIYDGYAEGVTKKGKHVMLTYPKVEPVRESEELLDAVKDFLDDVETKDDVTAIHCMQTFSKLYINGVEVKEKKA